MLKRKFIPALQSLGLSLCVAVPPVAIPLLWLMMG